MFKLHQQLEKDTLHVGDLPLSAVLLFNNSLLPWLILVPRREGITEWHQLEACDQLQLHKESMHMGAELMREFDGDKLNTGALGNIVAQLHLHHIVRFESDPVWPAPTWGNLATQTYSKQQAEQRITQLRQLILSFKA